MVARTLFLIALMTISHVSYSQYTFQKYNMVTKGGCDDCIGRRLISFKGNLFFGADDGVHGNELCVSDGTIAGTHILLDINKAGSSVPDNFVECNGQLFFTAIDTATGQELWVTDGTAKGTHIVMDITPGPANTYPYDLISFNNKLYFGTSDKINGINIWVTDGTLTGTIILKPELKPYYYSTQEYFNGFVVFNDELYFSAKDNTHGYELWKTDGTESGTEMVADIAPGINGSVPQWFTVFNHKLYFSANDNIHGTEPWVTDGTTAGTHILKDIVNGSVGSYSWVFVPYKDKLYFTAYLKNYTLMSTDGTESGTQVFTAAVSGITFERPLFIFNNVLYLQATYNLNTTPAILRFDGANLTPLIDVNGFYVTMNYNNSSGFPPPSYFDNHIYGNNLFFQGTINYNSTSLFVTDGANAGTKAISPPNIPISTTAISPDQFAGAANKLFFFAAFNSNTHTDSTELWSIYDPTAGISNMNTPQFCKLYPNPVNDRVNIDLKHFCINIDFDIMDITGRVLKHGHCINTSSVKDITVNYMSPGLYFINITADKETSTLKFIKE